MLPLPTLRRSTPLARATTTPVGNEAQQEGGEPETKCAWTAIVAPPRQVSMGSSVCGIRRTPPHHPTPRCAGIRRVGWPAAWVRSGGGRCGRRGMATTPRSLRRAHQAAEALLERQGRARKLETVEGIAAILADALDARGRVSGIVGYGKGQAIDHHQRERLGPARHRPAETLRGQQAPSRPAGGVWRAATWRGRSPCTSRGKPPSARKQLFGTRKLRKLVKSRSARPRESRHSCKTRAAAAAGKTFRELDQEDRQPDRARPARCSGRARESSIHWRCRSRAEPLPPEC